MAGVITNPQRKRPFFGISTDTAIIAAIGLAILAGVALLSLASARSTSNVTGAAVTTIAPAAVKVASVTDISVPFASTESDALVPRGFLGLAALGRLDIGCTVEVLKTTDRAAQVKFVRCPQQTSENPPAGTQGWVAKSALNLTSSP